MASKIFPPILQSTQTAFVPSNVYTIYFKLSSVGSLDGVNHIQIRVVRQNNNRTIVKTTGTSGTYYPDGIIYKEFNRDVARSHYNEATQLYSIGIEASDLNEEGWQPGSLYKIQLRFGTSSISSWINNKKLFSDWKYQQTQSSNFSEWSTVMLVKTIDQPELVIENSISDVDEISSQNIIHGLNPIFSAYCSIKERSKEIVDSFKFDLFDGNDTTESSNLIESSGWKTHKISGENSVDSYRFKTKFTNYHEYSITYSIRTANGYEVSSNQNTNRMPVFTFMPMQTYLSALEYVTLSADDSSAYCQQNGVIQISLTNESELTGNYVLSRASEKDNFTIYEDLKYFVFSQKIFDNEVIFNDFFIESGVRYRYAFQIENALGVRSDPIYSADTRSHYVNFEYSYLTRQDIQLKLKFNQRLSSFKHTTLRSKLDTLGDKYPHLVQNGNAYYSEFPISGLISFHMDDDQTFLKLRAGGFYYGDELVIPRDKFEEHAERRTASTKTVPGGTAGSNYNDLTINCDLTYDNIFVERKFREKVEEFLNDFEYKLYRSPTEGNMIIALMNVSLTPKPELGRMIYEFSATAYEVAENTVDNLNKFQIIDIGSFTSLSLSEVTRSFGQVVWDMTKRDQPLKFKVANAFFYNSNVGNSDTDIYSLIKQQEEVSIGGGYQYHLEKILSIWIEPCPDVDFTSEELAIKKEIADLLEDKVDSNDSRIIALNNELEEYAKLRKALDGPVGNTMMYIKGSRDPIVILPYKIYQLGEDDKVFKNNPVDSTIRLVSASRPIIINYTCELTKEQDSRVPVVQKITSSRLWGQIAGIFTDTDKILRTYDYDYLDSPTYRIYNPDGDSRIVIRENEQNRIVIDDTNINVYKTVNLLDIIKQEAQAQIELKEKTHFYLDENGELTDRKIYYSFSGVTLFDIEADPGTILRIGQRADGADAVDVRIGPTGRYTLNPMDQLVRYISLQREVNGKIISKPQFAVINYKCITNQMNVVYIGGQDV